MGNPIQCAGGQKQQTEVDIARSGGSPLEFVRYYSSTGFYVSPGSGRARDELGSKWRHTWQSAVVVEPGQAGENTFAYVVRPDGDYRHFRFDGGLWVGREDKSERLQELISGGIRTGWAYTAADDSIYRFDADGKWLLLERAGQTTTLAYSDASTPVSVAPRPGLLIRVTDALNRSLEFRYDAQAYLIQVTNADGQIHGFRYGTETVGSRTVSTGLLAFVDRPGGTSREYRYDEAGHVAQGIAYRGLLTGIVDENGQRYATFKYDIGGRAFQEWHGSASADLLSLKYYGGTYSNATSHTETTSALGAVTRRKFAAVAGIVRDAGTDRCTDLNCSTVTASSTKTYDNNGNPDLFTDFNGVVTDYVFGLPGRETQRVEAANDSLPATTSAKRTIQTDWHPTFRVPTERRTYNASSALEAVSRWAYNTRGQTTARCEIDPTDSLALAYTCSATTAPNVAAKVRRTVTTYCEQADVTAGTCPLIGLVTSSNGARATNDPGMGGFDDVTSYTYRMLEDPTCATNGPCTYRKGDLWKVTNALGQVTETVKYDKSGRPLRVKDANGTLTDFTYHARGWLVDRIVRQSAGGIPSFNDATTHIDYDAVGNVTKVTQPDGAFLAYTYDDAHRLIKITDNLNNVIDYCPGGVGSADCLDAAGNRIVEQTKDPSGAIKRSLRRTYNQLGQLSSVINASGAATLSYPAADGYDANGNATHSLDGLNVETKQEYDPLNRLKKTIQDYMGPDVATRDTTTQYAYDARDNLRTVTDPDGLATNYTYDGLNNLSDLGSPDTGSTGYTYDKAGNRITQTDARNITSTYTYDALNRLTAISYPSGSENVSFAYDQSDATTGCVGSYPKGRLTQMTDASGQTTYCYDRRGNVLLKSQQSVGVLTVAYTYTTADRLTSITYPSGAIVSYVRDSTGRVSAITRKANAGSSSVTVVSGVSYNPFGPLRVLTYGNGRTLTKDYDGDYAIDKVVSSDPNGLLLDFTTDVMGNIVDASDSIGVSIKTRKYGYDRLYRLSEVDSGSNVLLEDYAYNKTGDRTLKQLGTQAPQIYSYLAGTHRLGSVDGAARAYDENGNTLQRGDGVSFSYGERNRLAVVSLPSGAGPINKAAGGPKSQIRHQYNGRGERVSSQYPLILQDTSYVYDEAGHHLGKYVGSSKNNQGEEVIYLDDMPVAITINGVLSYLETDHLGTPRMAANPVTNAQQWKWDFFADAFGGNAPVVAPSGGIDVKLRYPGQYSDSYGVNYNYFRDYEAGTGRYLESDPIGLGGGINTYVYGINNILRFIDPFGLQIPDAWCGPGMRAEPILGSASAARCIPDPSKDPNEKICISGDCAFYSPEHNCSCMLDCMVDQSAVTRTCSALSAPLIGPLRGTGIGAACRTAAELECGIKCRGKCDGTNDGMCH